MPWRRLAPSTPLGVPAGMAEPWQGRIEPGWVLLLYTDGLVEERGHELDRGLRRLAELAAGVTDPEALCDHVLAGAPGGRDDDIALLALSLVPD